MSRHPLEIGVAGHRPKYLQPRFPQIGPAGDGPRVILCAQSGMGKTTAAVVLLREYLRIVDRVYIISSTINLDPAYAEMKKMIEKKYKEEGIDIDDPEENPFHEDLTALPRILAGMVKRTREAQDDGAARFLLRLRHGCTHCALALSRCRAGCAASRWSRLGERLKESSWL